MTQEVGLPEIVTQNRIIKLFSDELGYEYLGYWKYRENNSNIEIEYLTAYLKRKGYTDIQISRTIDELNRTAFNYLETLYTNNKNFYTLLRYGVKIKTSADDNFETIHLIDWKHPEKNHFGIAEEVSINGRNPKRPEIVLYVNGIALGVIELKRSTVSLGEGIRQNLTNQEKEFIQHFFSTIQLIFAGNDTAGLRYGTIETKEKYYLNWKEDIEDQSRILLDKYLIRMCNKSRFLELIYDFVLFDGGIKKLPRFHQYFGIKAAQDFVRRREGGIIWHTQGSGKSIVMILLAKWILENNPNARVAIITDREELDGQIERFFTDTGVEIKRTTSGKDLMEKLEQPSPRLLCSLVHKFRHNREDDFKDFIAELERNPKQISGELFVFVDECHRTQSGKFHKIMKTVLKNAVFIGFTGTPLLKDDRKTSIEIFGRWIHTYKFKEAVDDGVVLDLVYEARDIDQELTSPKKVDEWFEAKTKGLNDYQKSALKMKWGTMQKVLSSKNRMEQIVADVILDFSTKARLKEDTGNAMLVASSIFDACRFFKLFRESEIGSKCAIITSYNPSIKDITNEQTGAETESDKEFIYNTYKELLGDSETSLYEDNAKKKFIREPAKMKLLIVVDKLLTGFDAPPCTYLYIDKHMQDHGLFQAICRVNRLDGESKIYGYIIDYKDLFTSVEDAIRVYTSDLAYDEFKPEDVDILIKRRAEEGRKRMEDAIEKLALICEPVENPKDQMAYIRYFCGNTEIETDLKSHEPQRMALYKATAELIRAYANIADLIDDIGYTESEIKNLEKTLKFYVDLRDEIKNASGEILDTKTYEADMRHLIDTYIEAKDSVVISPFGDMPLLDIIEKIGISEAINNLPKSIKKNKDSVAETIENNVRRKIITDRLIDPAFYDAMSKLLEEIIKARKSEAIDYQEYLKKIAALSVQVNEGKSQNMPNSIKTQAQAALYNNLGQDEQTALKLDEAIRKTKKADWKGNEQKEREIKAEMYKILNDKDEVERLFNVVREQREYYNANN